MSSSGHTTITTATDGAQKPPTAPTKQEIARKLSTTGPLPTVSTESATSSSGNEAPAASSQTARKQSTGSAIPSSDDDAWTTSPLRAPVPLYAISEASDAASGTDSETSSVGGGNEDRPSSRGPSGAMSKALDRLKLSREPTVGMSDSVPFKSGYLRKKGERRKAWKKRWFVLRRGQLAMYKNEKEYLLLRLIPLSDVHTCAPIEVKKHSHTFGIVTPKRTYYIEARSDQEVKDWCTAVERAKEELKASSTVTTLESPSASGDITPRGVPSPPPTSNLPPSSLSTAPMAIPIPSSSAGHAAGPSSGEPSSMTTASPSPPPSSMTNSSFLSSSVTSASSVPTLNTTTRVPPNSYAQGSALGLNTGAVPPSPLELQTVDAGLERIAEQRQHEDGASSSLEPASMGMSQAGYFGHKSRSGYPATPHSPGLVSSSEDDDDNEDEAEAWPTAQQPSSSDSRMLSGGQPVTFAPVPPSPRAETSRDRRESTAPTDDKTIMSGYLMKQGKRKTWRKRWFILTSSRLMYSRSHMDSKIHRQIPLSLILDAIEYEPTKGNNKSAGLATSPAQGGGIAQASPASPSDSKLNNSFKIITPKRTYLVCAPSEEDEIRWLAALQCLVARKAAPPTPSLPPSSRMNSTAMATASPQATFAEHGRSRSGTLAAKQAIREAEKRFAVRSS